MKNIYISAFTLVEILIAVVILTIIVGIGLPALRDSQTKSSQRAGEANAKILNEGITRAHMNGDTNAVLVGSDVSALATYLVVNGYIAH